MLYCMLQLCTVIYTYTRAILSVDCWFTFKSSFLNVFFVLTKVVLFLCCLPVFLRFIFFSIKPKDGLGRSL